MFTMELQPNCKSPWEVTVLLVKTVKQAVNITSLPFLAMQIMLLGTNEELYFIFLNFVENDLPFYLFQLVIFLSSLLMQLIFLECIT